MQEVKEKVQCCKSLANNQICLISQFLRNNWTLLIKINFMFFYVCKLLLFSVVYV